jgi:transcriptional regulator with XRE-family HTH domain
MSEPFAIAKADKSTLGGRIRQLRKSRGWTLERLSHATGLAVSTLSKVETGKMSLTYDSMVKLARGLNIQMAELFSPSKDDVARGRRTITRRGEGVIHDTPTYNYQMLCTELANKRVVPIYGFIRARSIEEFDDLLRHPGEEFLYVISGAIRVYSDLYEPVVLEAGDSIYFDSGMGHAYVSVSPEDASVLAICSELHPDTARAIEAF